jgi:2-oxoglutarate dehydrogenase E2 component (dihydrolipoamide succinyltransferase)
MPLEIRVPSVGESVSEATVLRWLKQVGEPVAAGEDVVELETDKANTAVAAESAGVLEQILRQEGETVGINDVLGLMTEGSAASNGQAARPTPPVEANVKDKTDKAEPSAPAAQHARSTPLAARVAADAGVNLSSVSGTGSGGRIVSADVKSAAQAQASSTMTSAPVAASDGGSPQKGAPAKSAAASEAVSPQSKGGAAPAGQRAEDRIPMSRMRRVIAERLKEAQNTAAMLTTFNEVDLTAIQDLRKRRNELFEKRNGVKLGFMSFFTKASVGALKAFPYLNAEIQGAEIVVKRYYDIGIAVGSPEGLVVPVVRDADRKSFADIEKEIKLLAERAREKKLAVAELMGGTFTITNGGIFGSLMSTPILNYPQVGILGMHKIQDRAMVVNGQVEVRPMMYLALSYDHRIVDGSDAVRFLVRIKELVEDPESLLLEG